MCISTCSWKPDIPALGSPFTCVSLHPWGSRAPILYLLGLLLTLMFHFSERWTTPGILRLQFCPSSVPAHSILFPTQNSFIFAKFHQHQPTAQNGLCRQVQADGTTEQLHLSRPQQQRQQYPNNPKSGHNISQSPFVEDFPQLCLPWTQIFLSLLGFLLLPRLFSPLEL